MASLKADYEKADQEYKQHKDRINTITEDADSVKVMMLLKQLVKVVVLPWRFLTTFWMMVHFLFYTSPEC